MRLLRSVLLVVAFAAFLAALQAWRLGGVIWVDVAKGAVVAAALAAIQLGRWTRRVGLALAAAAVAAYFSGAVYGWPGGVHLWDQYHYFMGSRYFSELGYDGLYRCAAVAQDELGGAAQAEVRAPGRMIRNLGIDNTLVPVAGALADAGACRARFTPARWAAFRADVRFFHAALGATQWAAMQQDHGYNPPPAWTLEALPLTRLHRASLGYLQFLAAIDVVLLAGVFAALWWAFGWRTASVAAVFWGCQAYSSFFWTGGAFLRQDWLFLLTLSVCLARRRHFAGAGAAWAGAALLRIFPALLAAGWLVQAIASLVRRRGLPRPQLGLAMGALAAAAVVLPASVAVAGADAWPAFARHIRLHDRTPLTNHVGLRPLLAVAAGPLSGRARHLADTRAPDPYAAWKRVRAQREEQTRAWFLALLAVGAAGFAAAVWRVRRPWRAACLSQAWLVWLPQLTGYYYSFLLLAAPLRRMRVPLLVLAALSQVAWASFRAFDDRSALLGLLAVVFSVVLLTRNARRPRRSSSMASASSG
jgi:hypothetical protein